MAGMVIYDVGYGPPAPVPVFQWEHEFRPLLERYRARRPRAVLEIGTYHGGTLYHWLRNARPGATVVSVDSYVTGIDNRPLYRLWRPGSVTLHVVAGDSHDPDIVRHVASYAPYDWVFIDAGHTYPEVKADWETYGPMCTPGGLVCFHDIITHPSHPEIEVGRLWGELQADYDTEEIVADRHATWGGIGLIHIPGASAG